MCFMMNRSSVCAYSNIEASITSRHMYVHVHVCIVKYIVYDRQYICSNSLSKEKAFVLKVKLLATQDHTQRTHVHIV